MVVFEGSFDAVKFEECLRYVRDSLDWLLARGEVDKTLVLFPPDLLTRATETCKTVLLQLANLSNTRVTINRLPSEIFNHILLFLKDHGTPLPHLEIHGSECHLPALGLWSQASLVCRHWRQEVLETPGLWTAVRISDDLEAVNRWTTTWLSRSGALPLTVMFDTYLKDHHDSQLDILRFSETRRVSKLCFYRTISGSDLRSILTQVADHLEVLFLIDLSGRFGSRQNFDEPLCKLHRLRVLSMARVRSRDLRVWSTGELRHLSLGFTCSEWNYADLRGFLALLKANTRLEELMLYGLQIPRDDERWKISTAFPEHHWPIRMPKLKRLFAHEDDCEPLYYHPIEDILDQSLSLPPTCVRFYVASYIDVDNDCGKSFPFERMAVSSSSSYVVGTDGISACVLGLYESHGGTQLPLIDSAQVTELWLEMQPGLRSRDNYNYYLDNASPTHNTTILDMHHLVKLVVQPHRSLSFLLQRLENHLPALKELQILMQYHDDRQAILHFLTQRTQNGLQLDTLRFTGDPTSETSEAFDCWKENSQEFRSQVNQVVFEETCIPATGLCFKQLVSAGLGIPEACKYPSPTSKVWQPWDTYVEVYA